MELQVAGFAFLLGGVAMFAYQIWAWWRHTQQVRDHRETCIATVIANSDTGHKKRGCGLVYIYLIWHICHLLSNRARAVKGID